MRIWFFWLDNFLSWKSLCYLVCLLKVYCKYFIGFIIFVFLFDVYFYSGGCGKIKIFKIKEILFILFVEFVRIIIIIRIGI